MLVMGSKNIKLKQPADEIAYNAYHAASSLSVNETPISWRKNLTYDAKGHPGTYIGVTGAKTSSIYMPVVLTWYLDLVKGAVFPWYHVASFMQIGSAKVLRCTPHH